MTCMIDDDGCTAYRLTAFGSVYCLNHYGQMSGEHSINTEHPADDYEIYGEDEF